MLVSDYIRIHGLEKLTQEFNIEVKDYENYVVLNYSMIDSPRHNPVVDECRALILDKATWEPLARAFDRFYNLGEDPRSDEFDISEAEVWEKVDGSLILIWWNPYLNRWNASTRKMAHAEGQTSFGTTYYEVVIKAFGGRSLDEVFKDQRKERTYVFELTSPETRVVTPYSDYAMYALSMRDLPTGIEAPEATDQFAKEVGARLPKRYTFETMEDTLKAAGDLPTMEEGYVCFIDKTCEPIWRIKVKNPAYLAIAHLRNNGELSFGRVSRLVLMNDEEEYLSYFPEDRKFFQPYIDAREQLMVDMERVWQETKDIESQKDFALKVKDLPFSALLFQRRKDVPFATSMEKMTNPSQERLMENCVNHYKTRSDS